MTFRILLTSVGGAMSPFTIRSFLESKRHRIEVIGVDENDLAIGRHFASKFETVPAGDAPGYSDRIVDLVKKYDVDLVLPCSDEEVVALSVRADDIVSAGAQLAAPPAAAIATMSNKLETLRLLQRIGLPAPEWQIATSDAELADAIVSLRMRHQNVVVKPVRSRGSRDVYVIEHDRKGLYSPPGHRECYLDIDTFMQHEGVAATVSAPLLVMQGLRAPAYDTDVLCKSGTLLQAVPRRRVNPAGVPFKGGVIVDDARLTDIAARIVRELGVSWLFDIDTMTDEAGEHRVIEINSRPSGSLAAAAAAGMTILDDLVSLAKGEPVVAGSVPDQVTVLPYTSIAVV